MALHIWNPTHGLEMNLLFQEYVFMFCLLLHIFFRIVLYKYCTYDMVFLKDSGIDPHKGATKLAWCEV